jgi:hypothetical protein
MVRSHTGVSCANPASAQTRHTIKVHPTAENLIADVPLASPKAISLRRNDPIAQVAKLICLYLAELDFKIALSPLDAPGKKTTIPDMSSEE